MKVPVVVVAVLLLVAWQAAAAPAVITTDADGRLNCDGMRCPAGDGLVCTVGTKIANGLATVTRQCVNAQGAVLAENTSTAQAFGITYGRQTATALYKKN